MNNKIIDTFINIPNVKPFVIKDGTLEINPKIEECNKCIADFYNKNTFKVFVS